MWGFLASRNWRNLSSFRAFFGTFVVAGVTAWLVSLVWPAAVGVVAITVAVLWHLTVQMAPENVLYCPHCRKRVKASASVCHHCNRAVV
jgi:hypothetical protein